MNCACSQSLGSYERIPNSDDDVATGGDQLEVHVFRHSDDRTPKEVELAFYNDDGSCKTLIVEESLRAVDLCQLLALKNHVTKDISWAVVEHLEELSLERSLEDHEEVLQIHSSWKNANNKCHGNKFYFRKDFRKYEFLTQPQQFFPADMVAVNGSSECLSESSELSRILTIQTMLANTGQIPNVADHMWVKDPGKQVWRKAYFVLNKKTLYCSYKSKEFMQMPKFAELNYYNIFIVLDEHKTYKAPTNFSFCLKPVSSESSNNPSKDLHCFACETDKARFCWITAFRIAKYGNSLRDNYRSFKNRHHEMLSPDTPEYNSQQVPSESIRSRVAMDFTGDFSKVVDDPLEAEAIAIAEGRFWNKKRRPGGKKISGGILRGLDAGVHVTQPWFHSGLTREEATRLLTKHGTVDGVFLVRDSRSASNDYVLSFINGGKILHTRISPVEEDQQICYTLDSGRTKFYDLLQLVEFYQLNIGCLPTKLRHYIVQSQGSFGSSNGSNAIVTCKGPA